jgi:hypothetical protein
MITCKVLFFYQKNEPLFKSKKFCQKHHEFWLIVVWSENIKLKVSFYMKNYLQLLQLILFIVFLDTYTNYGNNHQLIGYKWSHVTNKKTYTHLFAIKYNCNWDLYIILQALLNGNGKLLFNFPKWCLQPHLASYLLYFVGGGLNCLFICFAFM